MTIVAFEDDLLRERECSPLPNQICMETHMDKDNYRCGECTEHNAQFSICISRQNSPYDNI